MGYYTQYGLDIIQAPGYSRDEANNLIRQFRKESEGAHYAIDDDGRCDESCKWYDHEKDLKAFSLKHPNVLFKLEGTGEDSGDVWELYMQAGHSKLCKAKLVFEKFDHSKLLADIRESKINKVINEK